MRPTALAFLFAAATVACPRTVPFEGNVYRDEVVSYRVGDIPPSWRRIEVTNANLAFRDERDEASVLVNGRCGHRDDDTPLPALTNHLIMGTTDREFASQEIVPGFDGREALHTVMRAKLDGVVMQYDIFVMKKDGCIYDLVYVAPPDAFKQGAPAFERFAQGFHTLR
jgi:hypothetical protein